MSDGFRGTFRTWRRNACVRVDNCVWLMVCGGLRRRLRDCVRSRSEAARAGGIHRGIVVHPVLWSA
jgi:hypothetical protein